MFLGGIMLSFISKYKYALLMMVLVFTPTSKVVFGLFGIAAGFVNWGFVVLIGIVVVGIKLNNKYDLSGINPFRSDEDDDL
jgi:hypothetical protein